MNPEAFASSINIISDFAFLVPAERFVPWDGRWLTDVQVSEKTLVNYLVGRGHNAEDIKLVLQNRLFHMAMGVTMDLTTDALVTHGRHKYLNMYVPPTMKPAPGPYPRVEAVLDWLTDGDAVGKAWLVNWIAAKVQKPLSVPKVAVVLSGSQGSGKGTLAAIIGQMLGPENCAAITERNLSNKFNARWSNKLFVLADEVMTRENAENKSEQLKILIDYGEIEQEKKGRDQSVIKSHIAWMFASNDTFPVAVEKGDRRYTVFTNTRPVSEEHKAMLKAAFDPNDRTKPTESFAAEIAGFMHHCLSLAVNFNACTSVYENDARERLISASQQSAEKFFDVIEGDPNVLDELLDWVADNHTYARTKDRRTWDLRESNALATQVFFACYHKFCSDELVRYPLAHNRFGVVARSRNYETFRPMDLVTKRQVRCYRGPWLRGEPKTETKSNVVPMKGGR